MKTIQDDTLRTRLIETFIDFQSQARQTYYRSKIQTVRMEEGREVYDGRLWECLKYPVVHSEARCRDFLKARGRFLCLCDKNRRMSGEIRPEPYDAVLEFGSYADFCAAEGQMPRDLYCFDEEMRWLVVLTREDIDGRRHCILIEDVRSL